MADRHVEERRARWIPPAGLLKQRQRRVIEAHRHNGGYRTVTDLDMLAVRFPGAGRWVPGTGNKAQRTLLPPEGPTAAGEKYEK